MPTYKERELQGACEAFGRQCVRAELYARVADRYDAQITEPSGTLMVEGRAVEWGYAILNIKGRNRKNAVRALIRKQKRQEPGIDPALARMTALAYLKELPCHLKCDIVARCDHCGHQHERKLIHDGTCEIFEVMKRAVEQEEEKMEKGDDLVIEYEDPRWPKGGENGQSK